MESSAALQQARALLVQHGLEGWSVRLDHARQRCGACHFARREITLSTHFVKMNGSAEVHATVLHEIAHALCGPNEGHGPVWRSVAARIGAPVQATNDSALMPEPRWHLLCLNCQSVVAKRHRRKLDLSRTRCRACGVARGHLEWRHGAT